MIAKVRADWSPSNAQARSPATSGTAPLDATELLELEPTLAADRFSGVVNPEFPHQRRPVDRRQHSLRGGIGRHGPHPRRRHAHHRRKQRPADGVEVTGTLPGEHLVARACTRLGSTPPARGSTQA